ncbi:putative zinc ribbon protein [Budvicia aquatica]|uniref:Protein of uncharacterized function (DUF3279) n=1 Tax=Budvicia aquatica TaxID=82979 RepID=A0A2C6CWD6_9GAMM|nr:putative zinc ribbon protein [Budvicia aquatica]PHI30969.1 hypothetical protein CRN84_17340 [Budvicia aquatica]VFS51051.1 Protein of uncharacterised function (DUF3279) [Budvicia aquatica]
MRMLKVFVACNVMNQIISAARNPPANESPYFCRFCGCLLILHNNNLSEKPWFEHDQKSIPIERLRLCTYFDPEVKHNEQQEELRHMVKKQMKPVLVTQWLCLLCGKEHLGAKCCQACGTDIYCKEI